MTLPTKKYCGSAPTHPTYKAFLPIQSAPLCSPNFSSMFFSRNFNPINWIQAVKPHFIWLRWNKTGQAEQPPRPGPVRRYRTSLSQADSHPPLLAAISHSPARKMLLIDRAGFSKAPVYTYMKGLLKTCLPSRLNGGNLCECRLHPWHQIAVSAASERLSQRACDRRRLTDWREAADLHTG